MRRDVSAAVIAIALTGLPAARCAEAPAAPSKSPTWEVDLAPEGEPGLPFVLEGKVLGAGGRPLRDVLIHVYHADDRGKYSGFEGRMRLSGMFRTNVLGGYRIHTVLPGMAEGNPHLHFEIAAPGGEYRFITLSLCRRVGAGSNKSFAHLPQMLELPAGIWAYVQPDTGDGFRCDWDLPLDRSTRLDSRPKAFEPQPR